MLSQPSPGSRESTGNACGGHGVVHHKAIRTTNRKPESRAHMEDVGVVTWHFRAPACCVAVPREVMQGAKKHLLPGREKKKLTQLQLRTVRRKAVRLVHTSIPGMLARARRANLGLLGKSMGTASQKSKMLPLRSYLPKPHGDSSMHSKAHVDMRFLCSLGWELCARDGGDA